MDVEKAPLLQDQQPKPTLEVLRQKATDAKQAWLDASKEYSAAWIQSPAGKRSKIILCVVLSALGLFYGGALAGMVWVGLMEDADDEYLPRRVALEAHVMSKCPDAKDCLHSMILPAMQNVSHMVDFKLSYIGTPNKNDDGVTCMHGAAECLGNIIELCAADLYPNPKIHLGFTMCLTRDYKEIPSQRLVEDCALEHGMDFAKLKTCSVRDDGAFGMDMLRASVQRSAAAGVTKSCTVRLDGETRCIRDGGKWTDCEGGNEAQDLVADILRLRNQHSPGYESRD